MRKTVVLNVVGLTSNLLGEHTPFLSKFAHAGSRATIAPVLPAVTCSVQTTYLTGKMPREHGIVGNGWYFRDQAEVRFWHQSNHLIQAPLLWDVARAQDPSFRCANLFWWFAMYSSADISITPRPMYPADGRKFPDLWTNPPHLRARLQRELGQFPLFDFWGPRTSIRSSAWIANAAKVIEDESSPTLSLIYLPHLDYDLQRYGPGSPKIQPALREIDAICEDLCGFYKKTGAEVVILSEYGITEVDRPVHLNRELRRKGYLTLREELGRELLDCGASKAFAVSDHQVAHVYLADPSLRAEMRRLLENVPGVAEVLDEEGKRRYGVDHPRAGDLVCLAEDRAWFTYYYWEDDRRAPDFARSVDIHRKIGYDPIELFVDPKIRFPRISLAALLLRKKLGFRGLFSVIGLDASLIRGSHGLPARSPGEAPIFLWNRKGELSGSEILATEVQATLLKVLGSEQKSFGPGAED